MNVSAQKSGLPQCLSTVQDIWSGCGGLLLGPSLGSGCAWAQWSYNLENNPDMESQGNMGRAEQGSLICNGRVCQCPEAFGTLLLSQCDQDERGFEDSGMVCDVKMRCGK